MSTFYVVPTVPESLGPNDMVLYKPTFLEEIAKTKNRRGVTKLTTASSLRDIFMQITEKYDNKINPYHLKLNKYEGIAYDIDEDLVAIVYRVIKDNDLKLVEAAIDHALKARPHNIENIYYVTPDVEGIAAFTKNGVSAGKQDEKGKKPKKSDIVV